MDIIKIQVMSKVQQKAPPETRGPGMMIPQILMVFFQALFEGMKF